MFQRGNCLIVLILAGLLMLATAPVIFAQTVQQSKTAKSSQAAASTPDLSGVWQKSAKEFPGAGEAFTPEAPFMQPWAEEKYKAVRQGIADPNRQGRDDMDPMLSPYCMLPGFPRAYLRGSAFEIIQSPGRVYMHFESDPSVHRIFTDGRKHPDGGPLTFMGHSIGRWEGDTLIAETVDLNEITWIDSVGHPHSDELRVEERFRRLNHETLEVTLLFDDPKAYKKPWGTKKIYKLNPEWELMEYILCEDPKRQDFLHNALKQE